jgi:predicted enzyme related to lactoylglutathione lyase
MATLSLGPIGQVLLAVDDIEVTEKFYRDTLGMKHLFTFGKLAFFDCHGTRLMLNANKEEDGHGIHHSCIYFEVPDIDAAHAALVERGVPIAHEPHFIHRHPDGTEEWMGFFSDPSGNLLAIMARKRAAEAVGAG